MRAAVAVTERRVLDIKTGICAILLKAIRRTLKLASYLKLGESRFWNGMIRLCFLTGRLNRRRFYASSEISNFESVLSVHFSSAFGRATGSLKL